MVFDGLTLQIFAYCDIRPGELGVGFLEEQMRQWTYSQLWL